MTYTDRKKIKIAGGLVILGIIIGILSIVPPVESDNFLEEVFPNKNQVLTGGIFQFFFLSV